MNCNKKREPVFHGSDFKLKVNITNLGDSKHLSDNDVSLTCVLMSGSSIAEYSKSQLTKLDDDTYVIPVKTVGMDKGDLFLRTTVVVPDTSFPGNSRTDIRKIDTGITII